MTSGSARIAWLLLVVLTLAVPFVARQATGTRPAAVMAASAGGDQLIIITPHLEAVRRKFDRAFAAWYARTYHRAVSVEYLSFGGGDIVKYFQAGEAAWRRTGSYNIDIVWGGSDSMFNDVLKPKYLDVLSLDPQLLRHAFPQPDIGGVPLYDPDVQTGPRWFGAALSSFGILYNRDLLTYLSLPEPRSWSDLADPRYRGWIMLADPTRSASARAALTVIVEREMQSAVEQHRSAQQAWEHGMGLIRQIAANSRGFTSAANELPGMVSSGDAAAAMTIDFYARSQIAAVGGERIGYVEPEGATIVTPEPIGMARGAPHAEVARRFIEFVLSDAGQRLWLTRAGSGETPEMSLQRLPIVQSVYEHPTGFTAFTNPYTVARGFNTNPTRRATFGLMDELISLCCIDLLTELRATRAEILKSPHASALDARLGSFPISQQQSARAVDVRRRMLQGRPQDWLGLQQQWRQQFRKEYRQLRDAAQGDALTRLLRHAVLLAVLLLFGVFLLWPICSVVSTGLGLNTPGVRLSSVTAYLSAVFRDQQFRTGILNSTALATLVTALCILISVPLALLARRYDFRGKALLSSLLLVPLVLPPFVGAIGIRQIFGAQGALTALCQLLGWIPAGMPVNWLAVHPFAGVAVSEAFSLYPILLVNVIAALGFIDPALEQAAANLGAPAWRVFRSVTLPLMLPGVFAGASIVFIWSFSELGAPLMFDFYDVTPVQVFFRITEIANNPMPYALLVVTMVGCCLVYALGKLAVGWKTPPAWNRTPAAAATIRLNGLRGLAVATPFILIVVLAMLPHVGVVLTSLSRTGQWYQSVLPRVFTLQHYSHALTHELALPSVRNSLLYSTASVVLDVSLGTLIGVLIVRSRLPAAMRSLLDSMAMLPLAVPGLVLAFGYLAVSLQIKAAVPGWTWLLDLIDVQQNPSVLLVMAYTMRRLPYVVRSTVAGLEQTPVELEQAAHNIGASRSQTLFRITAPLIMANLAAGALMVFAFTMLEVSDSLILAQKQAWWPITRGIFELWQRLGDGPYIACALGAWAMVLLALMLLTVNSLLGRRVGALFRI